MRDKQIEQLKDYKYGFSTDIENTKAPKGLNEKVKTVKCKKESKKGCNGKATKCVTHNLWDELETHINTFFENKSLNDLLKNNKETRV